MKDEYPQLSILIPVRNEGANIKLMLKVLSGVVEVSHEVLVVYDTDDDDTIPAVAGLQTRFPHVRLTRNRLGQGVAQAIRAGMAEAKGEYVLLFAADELGPVPAIEQMCALMDAGCDLVSGTRYAYGGRRIGGSFVGSLFSRLGNRIFRWISRSALTDATTGIKMFRRTILDRFELESRPIGWAVAFEISVKAQAVGLRLGEVPIISIDRPYGGESTFRLRKWLGEYVRWFRWGLRHLRGKARPSVLVRPPSVAVSG